MTWSNIAQATIDVLSVVLVIRLLRWHLQQVYRVFCVFLLWGVTWSAVVFLEQFLHTAKFDYRITWMLLTVGAWVLSLCMVYSLLQAILAGFEGIRTFSKRFLSITFLSVVVISLLTIRLDVAVSGNSGYLARFGGAIARAVRITLDLDRVISTVALLVMLVILVFVLWFPVQMPRNLAVFSIGLLVYFAANTGLLLTRGLWSRESLPVVNNFIQCVIAACYAYWTVFLTPQGETVPVRLGHRWDRQQQDRLIGQLEAMNASLLRAARR